MGKIKCFVTNQGRELLSKCQSDSKSITFTRLTAGSGVYSEDEDLKEKTSLKEHKQTFSSFYISRENGNVTIIRGILSNDGLEESYKVREIGIWAKEKDSENEILYAISITLDDEMADLMFVKQSEQYSSVEYNHYLKIDNDIEVTIVPDVDNSLARMYIEFDKLKARQEKRWDTDIRNIGYEINQMKKKYEADLKTWEHEVSKLSELEEHTEKLIADENGAHGIRYHDGQLQIKEQGQWEKIEQSYFKESENIKTEFKEDGTIHISNDKYIKKIIFKADGSVTECLMRKSNNEIIHTKKICFYSNKILEEGVNAL